MVNTTNSTFSFVHINFLTTKVRKVKYTIQWIMKKVPSLGFLIKKLLQQKLMTNDKCGTFAIHYLVRRTTVTM